MSNVNNSFIPVPAEPRDVSVEVMSSSAVRVKWNPPNLTHGTLTSYKVVVEQQSHHYIQAPGCVPPTIQPWQWSVDCGTTEKVIADLLSNMQFRVRVVAATKIGYGPFSTPRYFTTPVGGEAKIYCHGFLLCYFLRWHFCKVFLQFRKKSLGAANIPRMSVAIPVQIFLPFSPIKFHSYHYLHYNYFLHYHYPLGKPALQKCESSI